MEERVKQPNIIKKISKALDLQNKKRYSEAIALYKSLIVAVSDKYKYDKSELYRNLGNCYWGLEDMDSAASAYESTLKYYTNNASIYNTLGYIYYFKDSDKTCKYYLEGLKIEPDFYNLKALAQIIIRNSNYSVQEQKEIFEKYLENNSRKIITKNDIKKVATISANNDKEIGQMIADIIERVGVDGSINVENGKTLKHEIQYTQGLKINNGFVSPYFINQAKTQKCILENCFVLVTDNKLNDIQDISKILEFCLVKNKPLLIICDDIESEILATLIINKLKGALKICVVKAPSFGDNRKELLDDIALVTGGKYLNEDLGLTLKNISPEKVLGTCKKIIISKDNTTLIEGGGNRKKINDRINILKDIIKSGNDDKPHIEKRISKLTGGVAILKIGGVSETEVNELKDRIDDAICATKAAIAEGIVPGGGCALLYASKYLDGIKLENMDQDYGVKIVKKILTSPAKLICKNAGLNGELLINELFFR